MGCDDEVGPGVSMESVGSELGINLVYLRRINAEVPQWVAFGQRFGNRDIDASSSKGTIPEGSHKGIRLNVLSSGYVDEDRVSREQA